MLAIVAAAARKRSVLLLRLSDNGRGQLLTLSASVLAIIVTCPQSKIPAHSVSQQVAHIQRGTRISRVSVLVIGPVRSWCCTSHNDATTAVPQKGLLFRGLRGAEIGLIHLGSGTAF